MARPDSPGFGVPSVESGLAAPVQALVRDFPHGAVIVFDHNLRFVCAGGRGLADVGLSVEMLEGHTIWEAFGPEVAAAIEPTYRQALAGVETTTDTAFRNRVFEVRLAPLRDGGGICGGVGYTQDVTELRAAQTAVRDSEELFRTAFRYAPVGMLLMGLDGRFTLVNEVLAAILGVPAEKLVGRTPADITVPADRAAEQQLLEELLRGGRTGYELTKRCLRADGNPVWVSVSASRVEPADGSPSYIMIKVRDVHEQVVAQQERSEAQTALAAANAFQAAVLAATPDIISVLDVRTNVSLWASRSVVELLGYTDSDLARMGSDVMTMLVPPDDLEQLWAALTRTSQVPDGERVELRHRVRHADGRMVWLHRRITPFQRADDGTVTQVLSVSTDVTRQVEAELDLAENARELAVARDAAVAADQAKSNFLAATSHEIRTPLNGVLGMTGLLKGTALDPQQQHFVATAHTCGEQLLALLNDVLDFSKAEAGHLQLEHAELDLLELVDGAIAMVAEPAAGKGLRLGGVVAHDVPRHLLGDGLRLRQALLNLLTNAVKFTGAGEVRLDVRRCGALVRFAVEDTGVGIDPAVVPSLFRPFTQAESGTTRRYGGTGLGLAITRQIALLCGGDVGAEPRPDGGSTFWFTADLRAADRAEARTLDGLGICVQCDDPAERARLEQLVLRAGGRPGEDVVLRVGAGGPDELVVPAGADCRLVLHTLAGSSVAQVAPYVPPVLSGRVLLAEDNRVNQLVATLLLEGFGLSVDVVDNGRQAVEAALSQPYDAILMDCQMPELDGLDAVRELRARGCRTPVLALTAAASPQDEQACRQAGMDGYLTKPIDVRGLGDALELHLDRAVRS